MKPDLIKLTELCFKENHWGLDYQETVDSTNEWAKRISLPRNQHFCLASHQSSGRGRGTNRWLNTKGGDCFLGSWIFKVTRPPQHLTSPLAGLSLIRASRETWPNLSFALKAPNDLLLGGLKVAGLLVESLAQGEDHRLIVGLGFNVFSHPDEILNATHLTAHLEPQEDLGWEMFLKNWVGQLEEFLIPSLGVTELELKLRKELAHCLRGSDQHLEVLPDGSLKTAEGLKPWTTL